MSQKNGTNPKPGLGQQIFTSLTRPGASRSRPHRTPPTSPYFPNPFRTRFRGSALQVGFREACRPAGAAYRPYIWGCSQMGSALVCPVD